MTDKEILLVKYFIKTEIKSSNDSIRDGYAPLIINDLWEKHFDDFSKNCLTND